MCMAHRQLLVARWLGDEGLQARCRMHFVYSLVQCGRYRMALALIRELQADGHAAEPAVEPVALMPEVLRLPPGTDNSAQ